MSALVQSVAANSGQAVGLFGSWAVPRPPIAKQKGYVMAVWDKFDDSTREQREEIASSLSRPGVSWGVAAIIAVVAILFIIMAIISLI